MYLPLTTSLESIGPMCRIVRLPAPRDQFFRTRCPRFYGDHDAYFRLLVLVMAFAWGRRNVANLYRSLEAQHHRSRFHNFFLVPRWDPEAALRQKAQELRRALHPTPGETRSRVIDDSKKAKRGKTLDAIAKMQAPTMDAYIRGHQDVWGILVFRQHVIPDGIRRYVNKAYCPALGVSFRQTTELAAQLIRECTPPGRQGHGAV
jgi:hypothetical protein